jgi:hypothetical protein
VKRDVIYLKKKNIGLASLPHISWESMLFCPFALQSVLTKIRYQFIFDKHLKSWHLETGQWLLQ